MRIFAERELSGFLEQSRNGLRAEVQSEDPNRLLNVNETQYVAYLVQQYRIDPPVFGEPFVTDREESIPAKEFPGDFVRGSGKSSRKQVFRYHLPYSGNEVLLGCLPTTRIAWTREVAVESDCICFDIINWRNDPREIQGAAEGVLSNIQRQAKYVENDVIEYNNKLEDFARHVVQGRKNGLLNQANVLASLGVPVRKSSQVPPTFSVPVVPKRVLIKPAASTAPFAREPTLDNDTYIEILRIVHQTGVEMERHPNVYHEKDEATLRDYFIMVLSSHFPSVTGETFNKVGKTDILIRHEGKNVFVAECKFWKGKADLLKAIDQVLGYLTWRDSKAALIVFVRNKQLGPVLVQVKAEVAAHDCFLKNHGGKEDGWFSFEFHLKGDSTRSVCLAVLCFHFPGMEEDVAETRSPRASDSARP